VSVYRDVSHSNVLYSTSVYKFCLTKLYELYFHYVLFPESLYIKWQFLLDNMVINYREVYGVGLRPLACWDCWFESRWGQGCLSRVSVVCRQVEVSATSLSLVQRSPTDCGASLCVI